MDTTSLQRIPSEVVRHLSLYLPEAGVEALSETCVYLYNTLNDNSVWKRFQSVKQARNLLFQSQQLDPPFEPDPDLCENRQLTLMKNHLISNWRNQNYVKHYVSLDYHYASGVFNIPKGKGQVIYKEDYLFLGRFTNDTHSDAIEVWDIRTEPVLHSVIPIEDEEYDSFHIFDQALVVVVCSRVDVYEINVESKEFPLLYSFLITEDEVVWNKPAFHIGRHDKRCVGWRHYRVGNYLICDKCDDEPHFPVLHVWDISNACKVGAFVSPIRGVSLEVHHSDNEYWYISLHRQSGQKQYYFKFNIRSRKFSDNVFEYEDPSKSLLLFYKDHLIMIKNTEDADSEGCYDSICEVYDLNTSTKLQERRFDNAEKNDHLDSTTIVDGKFIILCKGTFLTVDALSLETVNSIPCESDVNYITDQINVYGQMFVIASEKEDLMQFQFPDFYFWDMENKTKLTTPLNGGHVNVNDSRTKVVIIVYTRMYVMHFW